MSHHRLRPAFVLCLAFLAAPLAAQDYRIAFVPTAPGARPGIWLANPDGSEVRVLPAERTAMLRPGSWSPDGRTILYYSFRPDDTTLKALPVHFPLYAIGIDGKTGRRVVDFTVVSFGWAPDSQSIFVISGFEDETPSATAEWFPKTALYVVDVQSGKRVRVTEPGSVQGASWAPDDSQLVYSATVPGDPMPDLFVVNRDGTGTRRVVTLPTADLNPKWSPDGGMIYFVSTGRGSSDARAGFQMIDVKSGAVTRIAEMGSWPSMQWSPDGKWLLADVGPPVGHVLVSPDGKARTPIGEIGLDAQFSPDAKELYFRMRSRDGGVWALALSDGGRRKTVDGNFFAVSPVLGSGVVSAIAALPRPTDRR
jgi:dipeptidyl aminopeptidase/acylaminoacyl peptidase